MRCRSRCARCCSASCATRRKDWRMPRGEERDVIDPGSDEPETLTEQAAGDALDLFRARIHAAGGTIETVMLFTTVDGIPGELNALSVAASDLEDIGARAMLTFLLGHAQGLAEAMGLQLKLIPLDG